MPTDDPTTTDESIAKTIPDEPPAFPLEPLGEVTVIHELDEETYQRVREEYERVSDAYDGDHQAPDRSIVLAVRSP